MAYGACILVCTLTSEFCQGRFPSLQGCVHPCVSSLTFTSLHGNATGSLVAHFKTLHGAEFFVMLNCAFYLPGVCVCVRVYARLCVWGMSVCLGDSQLHDLHAPIFMLPCVCMCVVPGLPVSVIQQHADHWADTHFGSRR